MVEVSALVRDRKGREERGGEGAKRGEAGKGRLNRLYSQRTIALEETKGDNKFCVR